MNQEDKSYFSRMLHLENPKYNPPYNGNFTNLCIFHCEIRNTARDVLLLQNLNLLEAKSKIERLLENIREIQ